MFPAGFEFRSDSPVLQSSQLSLINAKELSAEIPLLHHVSTDQTCFRNSNSLRLRLRRLGPSLAVDLVRLGTQEQVKLARVAQLDLREPAYPDRTRNAR